MVAAQHEMYRKSGRWEVTTWISWSCFVAISYYLIHTEGMSEVSPNFLIWNNDFDWYTKSFDMASQNGNYETQDVFDILYQDILWVWVRICRMTWWLLGYRLLRRLISMHFRGIRNFWGGQQPESHHLQPGQTCFPNTTFHLLYFYTYSNSTWKESMNGHLFYMRGKMLYR